MISISYDTLIIAALIVFVGLIAAMISIVKDTAKIPDISTRLIRMEHMLFQLFTQVQLSNVVSELAGSGKRMMFRTPDGKYTASSPEELMDKIMNDPDYPKSDEDLRKYFEDMMREDEEDDEDK